MSLMSGPKTKAFKTAIADMAQELNCDPAALATEAIAIQKEFHAISAGEKGMGAGIGYGHYSEFSADDVPPRNSEWNAIRETLNDPRVIAGKAILSAIGTEKDVHTFIGADRDSIELRIVRRHSSSDSIKARIESARNAYAEAIRIAGEKQMAYDLMVKRIRVRRTTNSQITGAANSLARANRMVSAFHSKLSGLEKEFKDGQIAARADYWEEFNSSQTVAIIRYAVKATETELRDTVRNLVSVTIPEAGHEIPAKNVRHERAWQGARAKGRNFHWEYPTETRYVEKNAETHISPAEKELQDMAAEVAAAAIAAMRESDEKAEKEYAEKKRRAAAQKARREKAKAIAGAEIAGARLANSLKRK